MISRTQRILGLDIGSSTVKGVELTKSGSKFTITGYAQAEIASAGTLKDAILAVVKEGRFKSKQVVSSVSGRSVIVRYINTPVMKAEELKSSMKFEADKYIPFEMDEVILDAEPLERDEESGDMRVVLVAVKKDIVNEHVRLLQEAGLYPYIIDVDCFALGNAFEMASVTANGGVPPRDREDVGQVDESAERAEEPGDLDEMDGAVGDEDAAEGNEPVEALAGAAREDEEAEATLAEAHEADVTATPDAPDVGDDISNDISDDASNDVSDEAADELAGEIQEIEEAPDEVEDGNRIAGPKFAGAIPDLEDEVVDAGKNDGEVQAALAEDVWDELETVPDMNGIYALIDIGAQKTNINIMNGQISCFTREVYVGGEDMTEAVGKHLGLSSSEAEAVKRQGEQEAGVLEAVGQTLDDLANEIFLSFDYFENQSEQQIETVFLSGGGSRLRGLGAVLSDTLGRPVKRWNPAAGMEIALEESQAAKFRENAPQMAVVLGLASRLRRM